MQPYQPTLRLVNDVEVDEKTAGDYLVDAPLQDLIIPPPYTLDAHGTYSRIHDENGVPHSAAITDAPVLITGRMQTIDHHTQWLRLAWKRAQSSQPVNMEHGLVAVERQRIDQAGEPECSRSNG